MYTGSHTAKRVHLPSTLCILQRGLGAGQGVLVKWRVPTILGATVLHGGTRIHRNPRLSGIILIFPQNVRTAPIRPLCVPTVQTCHTSFQICFILDPPGAGHAVSAILCGGCMDCMHLGPDCLLYTGSRESCGAEPGSRMPTPTLIPWDLTQVWGFAPVLNMAPFGEWNHGYATVPNGLTCWTVRGL